MERFFMYTFKIYYPDREMMEFWKTNGTVHRLISIQWTWFFSRERRKTQDRPTSSSYTLFFPGCNDLIKMHFMAHVFIFRHYLTQRDIRFAHPPGLTYFRIHQAHRLCMFLRHNSRENGYIYCPTWTNLPSPVRFENCPMKMIPGTCYGEI